MPVGDTTAMAKATNVLGVDFGRVINDSANHPSGDDTSFLTGGYHQAMATPEMAGAAVTLSRLSALFDGQVWVVSKCGPRIQELTQQWICHHDFMARAGIPAGNIRFCLRRPEKADHAAQLGITHFIDDRADVLEHLAGIVAHRYLFGLTSPVVPDGAIRVIDWAQAESAIRRSLNA